MTELSGQVGELAITLEITRAATGETETIHLIGKVSDDGGNALDSSPQRSD